MIGQVIAANKMKLVMQRIRESSSSSSRSSVVEEEASVTSCDYTTASDRSSSRDWSPARST